MKQLLLICCLLGSPLARAQEVPYQFSLLPLDAQTHEVVYEGQVAVPLASAGQLLTRLQTWAGSSGSHLQGWQPVAAEGRATRVVIRQGQEQYAGELTVRVLEGRYTYHLTRLSYTRPGYAQAGKHSTAQVTTRVEQLVYTRPGNYRTRKLTEINNLVQRLLASLRQTMQAEPDLVLEKGT